jgi:hypothetical protein
MPSITSVTSDQWPEQTSQTNTDDGGVYSVTFSRLTAQSFGTPNGAGQLSNQSVNMTVKATPGCLIVVELRGFRTVSTEQAWNHAIIYASGKRIDVPRTNDDNFVASRIVRVDASGELNISISLVAYATTLSSQTMLTVDTLDLQVLPAKSDRSR